MKINYTYCFELFFETNLHLFLPKIYIAKIEDNKIGYIEKNANQLLLKSYSISISPILQTVIPICESLSTEALTKKYNAKYKKPKPLSNLLEDKIFAKVFMQYYSHKLVSFLQILKENHLPLAINIDRTIPFFEQQVFFSDTKLSPKLHFLKNTENIIYTLSLKENEQEFFPFQENTKVILNSPSWILVNQKIYTLNEINGNKLKPFLTKKSIEIPERTSKKYFETFIKEILTKVEIEAEGFEMVQEQKIVNCKLKTYYNFLKNKYVLDLIFDYENHSFSYKNNKKFSSTLNLDNEIIVIQTKRNFEEEKKWEEKATKLGLKITEFGFFSFENQNEESDSLCTIQELIANKTKFLENGFCLDNLELDNKKISLDYGIITTNYQEKQDWFDVKMQITCGKFTFPFTAIISCLKNNNPFFELPNGAFFLIPTTWFSKYKPLIGFAKISNETITLKKNQFPILESVLPEETLKLTPKEKINYVPTNHLKATLRPYQREGVQWLLDHQQNHLGACLADDMGLGKTLQTIAVLAFTKENLQQANNTDETNLFSEIEPKNITLQALVVVPSSLVFNWKNETKKFAPFLKCITYTGNDRKKLQNKLRLYDVVFTSYPLVLKDISFFKTLFFNYLIVDESQYIKNKNSKIFKAINEMNTQNKIALSGTPIENSLDDLWALMQFINPDLLGTFAFFSTYFKNPIEKNKEVAKTEELKKLIQPYILRRTKEQVAKDLPALLEQVFYTEMEPKQKEMYEKEKSIARNFLLDLSENQNKLNVLNTLMKLRQISNHPKLIDANFSADSGKFLDVIEYLQTLVKAKQKTLVFSSFVQHLEIYQNWCKQNNLIFSTLTGATSSENREAAITNFQENDENLLFFISLKAGGVGLNLTKASYVLILDPWWNPFAEKQAIARAHRIGQKQQVNVVRFIAKDTVEEKIIALQQKKTEISETIIDIDKLPTEVSENLDFLLE